jgi:FixJ family two-component response regulator
MAHTPPVISIVDDDPSVRRALHRLVQSAGYTGETFASAGEFLDSSPLGRTACLVLDIHLGTTTGFDLEEQLAAYRAAIPIIFITARHDAATRERARRSGAAGYLPKPFEGQAATRREGAGHEEDPQSKRSWRRYPSHSRLSLWLERVPRVLTTDREG